jgi:hypothetical protein
MDISALADIVKILIGFAAGLLVSLVVEMVRQRSMLRRQLLTRMLEMCFSHYNQLIVWSGALLSALTSLPKQKKEERQIDGFLFFLSRLSFLQEQLVNSDARYIFLSKQGSSLARTSYQEAWSTIRPIFSSLREESEFVKLGANNYLCDFEKALEASGKEPSYSREANALIDNAQQLERAKLNIGVFNQTLNDEVNRIIDYLWSNPFDELARKLRASIL